VDRVKPLRPAVFIDRDGTVITERCYLADPAAVELLPGAAAALRRLHETGYALVMVTNQSGIARGYFSPTEFHAVQARVHELLAAEGVVLDGVYFCPHHPDFGPPCDCRKPNLGLFRRAAADLGLDLATSAYVGDRLSDVQPATALGGQAFLVRTGYGAELAVAVAGEYTVVNDLTHLADRLIAG